EEVVMIGYGTAKKRDLTGSIAKVNGSEVANKPNTNPVSSLQGKVAGLSIVNTGELNKEPDIRIRGTASRYGIKPLYVVDGIFNDNIDFINPNDIESIEVLKDPSSLAIFGVRGANGVIIVTTKQGKQGRMTVNYSSNFGVKFLTDKPEMTNAAEFKMLFDRNLQNQGLPAYAFYDRYAADTDWIDVMTNRGAVFSNNNISITSGNEKNKIYLGLGYLYEEGLSKNSVLNKYTLNINDELKVSNNFKVGVGINLMRTKLPMTKDYAAALMATPIVSPYNDAMGVYNQLPQAMGAAQLGNPLLEVEAKQGTNLSYQNRLVGNVFGEYKFFNDFTFRAAFMADITHQTKNQYNPVFSVYALDAGPSGAYTNYGSATLTSVNQGWYDSKKLQQDYLLTWAKNFGGHNITALAGFTTYFDSYNPTEYRATQYANGNPIPWDPKFWYTNAYPFINPTTLSQMKDTGDSEDWIPWERTNVSGLFRVLYNYKGKYMLNGSFRRDGSSAFTEDNPNRYQNFWSVGAAWEVTKESFMKDISFLNTLKLKGSYGSLGNQVSPYKYPSYPNYVAGAAVIFNDELSPAFVKKFRETNDLKWEKVDSYEAGFESQWFNRRLSLDAVYYHKQTKDLLNYIVQGSEKFFINAGSVENKGFEFSANWNDRINDDFSYYFGGNLTTLKNQVLSVFQDGYEIFDGPAITRAGDPIGAFYGYIVDGVYQTQADVLLSPTSTLGTYGVGDLKFKDINGDGIIDGNDRTIIGNPTPDFTYAFNVGINYKNWSLSADFQGVYGNEIYRDWGNGSSFTQFNFRKDRLNAWNGPGTSNWEPVLNESHSYNRSNFSTYMIEDGSYLRLRNIQLGYNFNPSILSSLRLQSLKLFVNAQNLITWKHNSGFTPDLGGSPTKFGVDTGGYPLPIVATFGVNVQF
ncbi:SusC/RagA family TonB-linked outer membrane protein, partial [uncultured Chryseobacterium sp.]|uniref:SusC/RagA family TonB-linked outer membrane protein n=1 Tax=uncultured Chryseobacterium sp. TaxID=259322 RepID=UPI00261DBB0A